MKILITGGAGFIGSAVIRDAISRNHQVVNVDSLTYAACLDNLASVESSENYFFENVDICNQKELNRIFSEKVLLEIRSKNLISLLIL